MCTRPEHLSELSNKKKLPHTGNRPFVVLPMCGRIAKVKKMAFRSLIIIVTVSSVAAMSPHLQATDVPEKTEILITSLPDEILLIIGQRETEYFPRVYAIHSLENDLPPDQVEACIEFLYRKLETQALEDLEFNGLKNELVLKLMRQKSPSPALATALVEMYRDRSYDDTWRNYCVQFFGKCYPYLTKSEDREQMTSAIYDALHERTNRIAGTAGYMLSHMVDYPGFDRQDIIDRIYEALIDPVCSAGSRIMLLQASAELGDRRALPVARKLMQNTNPLLRMSAIGAIGYLGDASDLPELEKLADSNDLSKQTPARSAIEKIKQRMVNKR